MALGALLVAWSAQGPLPLGAQEYHVDRSSERSVVFTSSAPLEEFQGVTDRIDGYVLLDGEGVREVRSPTGTQVYFEVELASLDTGIALRDRHMRDDYLEVDEHPYAAFRGEVVAIVGDGASFQVEADGTFTLHGIERPQRLRCRVTPDAGSLQVGCRFQVRLEDHGIPIPRLMFMKLAEETEVELAFRLRPAS